MKILGRESCAMIVWLKKMNNAKDMKFFINFLLRLVKLSSNDWNITFTKVHHRHNKLVNAWEDFSENFGEGKLCHDCVVKKINDVKDMENFH